MRKQVLLTILISTSFLAQAAIPTGYYHFALGKKKAELKTTLHEISAPLTVLDYGSGPGFTWQGFYATDRNADNTVRDMYSNNVRSFNGYNSIADMAIEHSFPKSWWGAYENMAYKDLFHLYPADAYTNGIKNNLPLGEVTGVPMLDNGKSKVGKNGFGTAYSDNSFEPADEYKGDFARTYFYMVTAYDDKVATWVSDQLAGNQYPALSTWSVALFLRWNSMDRVSDKETNRNEAVYGIQGNRNPFIDHPELAEFIWGSRKGEPWSLTSAVDDLKIDFTLSPNPVRNQLTISSDEPDLSYSIFNLNGQLLQENDLYGTQVISVDNLNNGMYLIQVKSGNRRTVQKFIVSH